MGKKRKRRDLSQGSDEPFTLGDMLKAKGIEISRSDLPSGPDNEPTISDEKQKADPRLWQFGANIRLKRERKGRGGKTVTLVEGLDLPAEELKPLAKSIRQAMGAGAKTEGDMIVVQGDIGERLKLWLQAQGASRVRCV